MIPTWVLLTLSYVVWNVGMYLDKNLFGADQRSIDIFYWTNERIFVLLSWIFIYQTLNKSEGWKKYKWVAKVFIPIAALKLTYLLAIIIGWLNPNDLASVLGFIVITALGYIIQRWEKLRRKQY